MTKKEMNSSSKGEIENWHFGVLALVWIAILGAIALFMQ